MPRLLAFIFNLLNDTVMTQIQINGKDYKMSYNLSTAIAYERMTGKNPLQLEQFTHELEAVSTIAYCMLLSNNDPIDVPDYEEFVKIISDAETLTEIINAASLEMQSFFVPKKVSKKDTKKKKQKKEADSKNS